MNDSDFDSEDVCEANEVLDCADTTHRGLDLWDATTTEVRALIDEETDPEVLGCLWEIYEAKANGDEMAEFEAIGGLSDLLVLNRGGR